MMASFEKTISHNGDDIDVLVEYRATRCFGDVDIEITGITHDGVEIDVTDAQFDAIVQACFDRVDDDYQSEIDGLADYRMGFYDDRD